MVEERTKGTWGEKVRREGEGGRAAHEGVENNGQIKREWRRGDADAGGEEQDE
jgi:hypothetical protein